MPCSCFLPSCVVCQPPREADLQCSCKLPSCRQCFPEEQELSTISLTGKGRPASPEAEAIIAAVDHRLRKMLARCKVPAYLVAGPDFGKLPTKKGDIGKTGSRHDHLVAFLCNVGVRAVQTARCSTAPAAPRGRKRLSSSGGREEEHGAAPTALPAAHGDDRRCVLPLARSQFSRLVASTASWREPAGRSAGEGTLCRVAGAGPSDWFSMRCVWPTSEGSGGLRRARQDMPSQSGWHPAARAPRVVDERCAGCSRSTPVCG